MTSYSHLVDKFSVPGITVISRARRICRTGWCCGILRREAGRGGIKTKFSFQEGKRRHLLGFSLSEVFGDGCTKESIDSGMR